MAVGPFVVGVSELRRRLAALIDEVDGGQHPLFITHHGRVTAVLISPRQYHAWCPPEEQGRHAGEGWPPIRMVTRKPPSRRAEGSTVLPTRRIWTQYGWCDFVSAQILAEQGVPTELIPTEEGWMTDDEG